MSSTGRVLFLLRSYNDIDHIAPLIWKATVAGVHCCYFFSDRDYSEDYRIQFLAESGAQELRSGFLRFYHQRCRKLFRPYYLRRLADFVVTYSVGSWILVTNRFYCLVNEWSGPYGRGMAEYLLRSGHLLHRRCISVPHGYHFWTSKVINKAVRQYVDEFGELPSFANRSKYTHYVVQTENIRDYYLSHQMPADRLRVLGSARFCGEWREVLEKITPTRLVDRPVSSHFVVLVFIPDWDYFIDRLATISLLNGLLVLPETDVCVKQNTRGTGTITADEIRPSSVKRGNIFILGDEYHSVDLIKQADCIINFASSIGLEALAQGKPVCNPTYLTENTTIFDNSGAVVDTSTEEDTVRFIDSVRCNQSSRFPHQDAIDRFLVTHINAGQSDNAILDRYLSIITRS